ncbi:MAG: hypothetical protein ACI87X_001022, partial [Candidatus Arcticimaribacter sp.]
APSFISGTYKSIVLDFPKTDEAIVSEVICAESVKLNKKVSKNKERIIKFIL